MNSTIFTIFLALLSSQVTYAASTFSCSVALSPSSNIVVQFSKGDGMDLKNNGLTDGTISIGSETYNLEISGSGKYSSKYPSGLWVDAAAKTRSDQISIAVAAKLDSENEGGYPSNNNGIMKLTFRGQTTTTKNATCSLVN